MNQQGSFIPRQAPIAPSRKARRSRIYVFGYVAYVIFFATLITVVVLFLWSWQSGRELDKQQTNLETARTQFQPADLEIVREADTRLRLVKELVDTEPAFSKLLVTLSENTTQSIQLSDLSVAVSENDPNEYDIKVSGIAPSFDALLFQRDVWASSDVLKAATFTDIAYEAADENHPGSHSITYTLSLLLPTTAIAYDGILASAASSVGVTTVEMGTTDTASTTSSTEEITSTNDTAATTTDNGVTQNQ